MDIFSNPPLTGLLDHPLLMQDDKPSTVGLLEWHCPSGSQQPSASWEEDTNDEIIAHLTVRFLLSFSCDLQCMYHPGS